MAKRDTSEQVRRFGPLTFLLVAAAIAFIVLPSTLTLPNPSPTSQEEIAPVPPTQSKINPPVSNFTNLNSGNTGNGLGLGGGGTPPPLPPLPTLPPGVGHLPDAEKECVDGRQTEDQLSPTCVPFFEGSNGGATYQGVSGSEVKILIYFDPYGTLNTSQGQSLPPYNTIVDVNAPPKGREHPSVYTLRAWQKFFNRRYMSYDRTVHFFVQFGSYDNNGKETAGTQAQDGALAYAKVRPFAVVNYASFGNGAYYNNYMAEHGVLNFGSVAGRSASFYKQFAGKQWGYKAPIEYAAAQYANFVCTSLKNKPADDMGNNTTIPARSPRKFGLLYTTDKAFEGLQDEAVLAAELMKKQCGITFTDATTATYDHNSFTVDNSRTPDYGINIALKFQQAKVTTVLWPAGYEAKISPGMKDVNYYPEIILGDEDQQASNYGETFQDQAVWAHAWIVTSQTYDPPPQQRICVTEYRTVDQTSVNSDVQSFACEYYNDLRQLFTGIQVAGPTLTPQTLDQGFHAIPLVESTNPQLPTCYYLANDYTCVKDSTIEHWDGTAQTESSRNPGCWRMVANGKRYLPGKFPGKNLLEMKKPGDVCNNFNLAINLNPGTT